MRQPQQNNRATAQAVLTGVRMALAVLGVPADALLYRYVMQEAQVQVKAAHQARPVSVMKKRRK